MIDTGAPVSAIERETWEQLEARNLIQHLPFVGRPTLSAAVGGHSIRYKLGRLWVRLRDLMGPNRLRGTPAAIELPAVPIIAQLILENKFKLPYPFVLGLHLGVLDGRRLTREHVPLLPSPIPPNHTSDCGAWYGQEWYLETA